MSRPTTPTGALLLRLLLLVDLFSSAAGLRTWPVTVMVGGRSHKVAVSENEPVLAAVERAGLLPGCDCRRGSCLSCAARVVAGNPWALQCSSETALCPLGHEQGLVLLCSSFVVGDGLCIELDADGDAWDVQYNQRFSRGAGAALKDAAASRERPPVHYTRSDALGFLEPLFGGPPARSEDGSSGL